MSRHKVSSFDSDAKGKTPVIGDRIRQFREGRGMSQADLAKAVGVSKTTVYNAEKGNQALNYKLLFGLVVSFSMNAMWLLMGEEGGDPTDTALNAVIYGHIVKRRPGAIRDIEELKKGNELVYFPLDPDEELVKLIKSIEEIYTKGTAAQREALSKFVDAIQGVTVRGALRRKKIA